MSRPRLDPFDRVVRSASAGSGTAPAGPSALAGNEVPDLAFAVVGADVDETAAMPAISLRLDVRATGPDGAPAEVRSLLLRTQVRIAPRGRSYDPKSRERLAELFGTPEQWGSSLQSLLWAQPTVVVPCFRGEAEVALPIPCTYDFEVAASKYLDSLSGGEVPLELLFSGTLFYARPDGALRTALLAWQLEARHRLPVAVWRRAMDRFFPGTTWLRLSRETFERLARFKVRRTLPTWDGTVEALLENAEREEETT